MSFEWLPSYERRKKRRRKLSPEAYERTRESVKGPEELSQDMEKNSDMAEMALALELEPKVQEKLKKDVEAGLATMGSSAMFASMYEIDNATLQKIEEGNFTVTMDTDSESGDATLAVVPDGNVSEKIPIQSRLSEQYIAQMTADEGSVA